MVEGSQPPRHVAVAIVYDTDARKVLMVSSRAHPGMWILPKGGIEDGETSGQAAVRESYEEAGTPLDLRIPGDEDCIALLTLEAGAGQKRAAVWHVHVVDVSQRAVERQKEWPEAHERIREWVSLQECLKRIEAWSTNSSTAHDIASQGGVLVESSKAGKKGNKAKKEAKSAAMETALRQFVAARGLEEELSDA